MTKQKKQTILLTCLIVIMLAMGIGYTVLKKINQVKDEEAKETIELYQLDTSKAKEITIENESGKLDFVKRDNKWSLKGDSAFPVNKEKIDSILDSMKTVSANSQVTDGTDELSQYGLGEPSVSILVTLSNNVKAKVSFGTQVPVLGGYYALVDDDTKIYTMNHTLYENIQVNKMDFVKMDTIPTIESDQVNKIKITENDTENLIIEKTKAGSYVIKKPYKDTVSGNSENILELLSKYSNLSFDNCIEYNCTDFQQYGLEKPKESITVTYKAKKEKKTEQKEYTLYVGNQNNDGAYYVRPKNSSFVYEISADTIDELIHVKAFDYVEKTIFSFAIDTLQTVIIKDENGKKRTLDKEKDLSTLTSVQGLIYSGEIKKKILDETKIYECTIKNDNKTSVITFLPYDKSSYRVNKDGQELFLVSKKAVNKLLTK